MCRMRVAGMIVTVSDWRSRGWLRCKILLVGCDWMIGVVKRQSLILLRVLKSSEPLQTPFPITPPVPSERISSNMAQKSSQNLSITDNINSFNYNHVINVNTGTSDEDDQIREWLSPLKPQQRHQDVRTDRLDGVGNWLLETREFRKWSGGEAGCLEQVLFCSGGPGVGKTYLMQRRSSPKEG